jgi:hypothetical protein
VAPYSLRNQRMKWATSRADRRRPVGLVLHGLPHDPGGLAQRQACGGAIRAAQSVVPEERVGASAFWRGQRFVEKLELAT